MYTYTRVYTYYGTDTEQPTGRIGVHWVCFDTESIRVFSFLAMTLPPLLSRRDPIFFDSSSPFRFEF